MTKRLHADEVHIDADLVRQLVRTQMPDVANLELRPVLGPGTDNLVFRLGPDLSVRLPRKPSAVRGLLIEREWLPRMASRLPLAVPLPVASGEPSDAYPFPWLVCTWVHGTPLPPGGWLASDDVDALAEFIVALQAFDTTGGPLVQPGQRAGLVAAYDATARTALEEASLLKAAGRIEADFFDEEKAVSIWQAAVEAAPWEVPGVWVHRDLQGDNLVTVDGRLSGVLDFGGLAVGDPAGNVMAAFHLPGEPVKVSRSDRRRRRHLDPRTWLGADSGLGGVAVLPGYSSRNGRDGAPGHPGDA